MTIYYVDFTGGNDANGGLSDADAWKTITKVNGETFIAGDRIRFKRGETWTGIQLTIGWSGTISQPIIFEDYGDGALPIIDGNDAVNCIACANESYITFINIHITAGLNFGFYMTGSDHISLFSCEADTCGNDNVIFITDCSYGLVRDLVSYDAYERAVGPRISCLEIADGSHDIEVYDSEFYGSESTGITIHSHPATEFPYNVLIQDCDMHDNDDFGIIVTQTNAAPSLPADVSVHIVGCTMTDNAGPGGGAGIYISNTGDPYPDGILFQDCISITATERPLFCGGTARFLRCVFDGQWQTYIQGADDVVIDNCTFYRTDTICFTMLGTGDGVVIRNCIFYTGGTTIIDIQTTTNVDMDYNLYYCVSGNPITGTVYRWGGVAYNWANWLINSGQDANSPTPADPLFIDLPNDDFRLQADSPAIDEGVDINEGYCGSAPDLGYWEYCVSVDEVEGFSPWLNGRDEIPDISSDDECPR